MSLDLEWCASWEQDGRFYCTLFIVRDYANTKWLQEFLVSTFGKNYGSWRYDHQRHGIEIWFRSRDDMLAFKLITQSKSVTV